MKFHLHSVLKMVNTRLHCPEFSLIHIHTTDAESHDYPYFFVLAKTVVIPAAHTSPDKRLHPLHLAEFSLLFFQETSRKFQHPPCF